MRRAFKIRSGAAAWMGTALAATLLLGACERERPRGFIEYMEDALAREGTLARCNQDREATALDVECANARRAAAAVAARQDSVRRRELEQQSEQKRAALRMRIEAEEAAQRMAELAARAAEEAAYEAQWAAQDGAVGADPAPLAVTLASPDSAIATVPVDAAPPVDLAPDSARAEPEPSSAELSDISTGTAAEAAAVAIPRPFRSDAVAE
jgi:hypothetical protein